MFETAFDIQAIPNVCGGSTLITYKHFIPSLSAYMLQTSLTADMTYKKINKMSCYRK